RHDRHDLAAPTSGWRSTGAGSGPPARLRRAACPCPFPASQLALCAHAERNRARPRSVSPTEPARAAGTRRSEAFLRHRGAGHAPRSSITRSRNRIKRGGGQRAITLDEGAFLTDEAGEELVALDQALERLTAANERAARVVEQRFFAGL